MATINFNRITVDQDIRSAGGRLLVEKGAIGTIVGRDQGYVDVLFDQTPHFVELSGCNQRLQSVPFIYTSTAKE